MRVENFETTINEILELEPVSEDRFYEDFSQFTIFEPVSTLDTYGITMEVREKLVQKDYVQDFCNDCRSRQLSILFYKETPFVIFQYMGRGYIDNEAIFNKEIYKDFINDFISEYLSKQKISVVNRDSQYTVINYNMAYFEIKDNKIIANTDHKNY